MEIFTDRLILRPFCDEDGPALAQATEESWDDLSRWMRWATDRAERSDIANCTLYARLCGQKFHLKHDYVFAGFTKNADRFILTSRLSHDANGTADVYELCGYWCRTSQQGKGYMTEAVRAIIDYAFTVLGAKKILIKHAAGNHATRAMMDKLGFVEEAVLPNAHQLPNGELVDEYVLSLVR